MAVVRLESLKLTGFKSFPDEVELAFPGSVSAIIGPNGCGKSNLVDAMLWVLGEQSPSLLRLKQMGDVVFSGASGRKPAGSAEVQLVLKSEDGRWADHGGRLEVRRRVLRSGPSEYRMNGRVARLKDIVDELLSVGLGMRNYAIIEQGRVGQVLSARPTDRRVLLEEAAGITRYKIRKREAELKLEHTRQNLIRLDDVIDEVTRSLRQLKRQANAADRFQKMQLQLAEVLRELHVSEAHALASKREDLGRTRARFQNDVAAAASNLGGAEADLMGERKKLEETRASVETARSEVARLDTSRERLETFLERSADLLDTLRASIDRHRVDAATAQEKRQEVARNLAESVSVLESCRSALQKVEAEVAEAATEEAEAKKVLQSQEELATRRRGDLLRTISTLTGSRNRLSELEREQDRLSFSKKQLEQEGERLSIRLTDVRERHDEAVAACRSSLDAAAAIEEGRSKLVDNRSGVRERAQATKADAESLSHKAWELRHQLSGVERELASHQAAAERLAELLPEDLLMGQLSDHVRPRADAAAILDRVWREWLELPVVRSGADTADLLADLSGVDERIRLVVAEGADEDFSWPELEGAKSLLETAGFADDARPWLLRTLPPAYVVEDDALARDLAGSHPEVLILDSRGVLWRGRTAETPGEGSKLRGALVLRTEKESLSRRIEETTETASASSEKHRALIVELENIDEQLAEIDRRAVQVEQDRGRAAAVEESLGQERARLEKEIVALTEEQGRTDRLVVELRGRRTKTETEVQSLEERSRELEGAVEQAGEALDGCRETAADRLRRLDRWKAEQRLAKERQSAAAREEQRLRTEGALLEGQLNTLEKQKTSLEKKLADTEQEVVRSKTRLIEEQGSLVSARQRERVEAEKAEAGSNKVTQLEVEVRRRREAHDAVREQLHNTEIEVGTLEGEWARLRDACLADIGEAPESLITGEAPVDVVLDELREQSEKLRARIDKMGPVNLLALQEVDELQLRSEFLGTQRDDLVASLKSLDETIREIDATCTERFVSTFEQVNELFAETFHHLFGGGTSRLELVDEDDPLESGVDVIAQPPGKKNQSVQLLSGGEKALTALALLISLFRIKPSPFCILDEVDAPLDDANVERLAELVRSMTSHTQFVMITHNRRTMQRADVLYGVTMEEAGVSKIVSVRVE